MKKGEGEYALSVGNAPENGTMKLKKFGSNATIGAFRAYFTLSNPNNAAAINFTLDNGETTDIAGLNEALGIVKPANVYNLNGQVVRANATSLEGLAKGIYLFNGKKYVVK